MQLRPKVLLVSLFLLCYNTILSAQTLDSLVISQISSEVVKWTSSEFNQKVLFISTNELQLRTQLEHELLQKKITVVKEKTPFSLGLEISHKGEVFVDKSTIRLNGTVFIRADSANVLLKTKRILVDVTLEKPDKIELKSTLWPIQEAPKKESAWKSTWLEPMLILSTMAISVYLLFAVRS